MTLGAFYNYGNEGNLCCLNVLFFEEVYIFLMCNKRGSLVKFNSHSVGNYADMHGSHQVIIEEDTVGIMLNYTCENLCEVLLQGDVVFNVDPVDLDNVSEQGEVY